MAKKLFPEQFTLSQSKGRVTFWLNTINPSTPLRFAQGIKHHYSPNSVVREYAHTYHKSCPFTNFMQLHKFNTAQLFTNFLWAGSSNDESCTDRVFLALQNADGSHNLYVYQIDTRDIFYHILSSICPASLWR